MNKGHIEFFCRSDLIKACVGTSACVMALFFSWIFRLDRVDCLFLLLSATTIALAHRGVTKKEQWLSYLCYMFFLPAVSVFVLVCYEMLAPVFFYLVVSMVIAFSQVLPRYFSTMSIPSIIFGVFLVISASCASLMDEIHGFEYVHLFGVMMGGIFLTALISGVLPLNAVSHEKKDVSDYVVKRSIRIGIAILIGYGIADFFHLLHPSWLLLTVLAVSRMSLGASVRRCGYRLAGTFLGFLVAVPLAQFVFLVWPWTQWFALVFLFMFYLLGRLHYITAVFFITLTLGVSFYLFTTGDGAAYDAYAFIQDRLIETLVGIIIAMVSEVVIFPHSVLCEIRLYTEAYWRLLASSASLLVDFERTIMFSLMPKKKLLLDNMTQALMDYRYEPLGALTLRYHRVVRLVSSIHHLQKRLMRLLRKMDGVSVDNKRLVNTLIAYMNELEKQYQYSLGERSLIISDLLDRAKETFLLVTIKDDKDMFYLCHSFLTVLYRYDRVLKTSKWSLRWTRSSGQ